MSDDPCIVGVAYRLGEAIISMLKPNRHHNILSEFNYGGYDGMKLRPEDSGFLLSDGTFANRKIALQIATANGQLIPRKAGQYNGPELFSEDVW